MLNNIVDIFLKEILFIDVDVYDFKSNIYCGDICNAELSFKIPFQRIEIYLYNFIIYFV